MTVYLIRHAHAGTRTDLGTDHERPLSAWGREQADHLATLLAPSRSDSPVQLAGVFSSSALRCQQTVASIAAARGLTVELRPELAEGAATDDALAFVESFAGRDAVLCSHGDVIPKVLRRLASAGRVGDRASSLSAKGSMWELLTSAEGTVEQAIYHPPLER